MRKLFAVLAVVTSALSASMLLPGILLAEEPSTSPNLPKPEAAAPEVASLEQLLAELSPLENAALLACTASMDCGDGNTISCTGNSNCFSRHFAVPPYVECDGNRTYCPNMCFVQAQCPARLGFVRWVQCASNVGDCQQGSQWVRCDGQTYECQNILPD